MTESLRCGTKNPQLIRFEEDFELSEFAFVVECSNWAAPFLLERNPSAIIPRYGELEKVDFMPEEDRETPFNDSNPTAWLFPRWRAQKVLYFFGTSSSQCDVCLPTEKQISRRHFAIYLSQSGIWTVRNLSRYGTWVNGDLLGVSQPGQPVIETALNPDCENEIRVGLLEFLLHPIPHAPLTSQNSVAASLLLGLGKPSEGTRTTSATESTYVVSRPANSQIEPYFYLRSRPIVVQGGSEVCAAIHKRSSLYYLAKLYESDESWDKANAQYEMMLSFTNHAHIAFYIEWLLTETGAKIISPHLDAVPLCALLIPHGQIYDIEMAFMVYKQMAEALTDLRDHGVVHNDINDSTILVELPEGGRYISYLTGFSEYSYADANLGEAFRRDLSDLTKIMEKMLPVRNGLPCCDPDLRTLMMQTHEGQIQAKELSTALSTLAPDFKRTRFQRTLLTTDMSLNRVVDDDGTEAVRLLDILRIILHERPQHMRDVETAIKKVIRTENLFQLEGETYCSLYDAEKLIHHLHRAKHTRLLELKPPTHNGARFYQTTHEGSVMVSYHEPTGMVNLTQILNLFDTETVQKVLRGFDTSNFREIRGSPQWEGYHIHRSILGEILSRLPVPVKHYSWNDNRRCYEIDQFFGDEDTISIATDEMINLILFSRKNEMVTWGDQTLNIHDAIKVAEDHGLPVARDTLVRITSESASSTSIFYSDDDILKLFDQADDSDYPTEATSHNSFLSQDSTRFTPKKKKHKGNSDVPILPVQRKSIVDEHVEPAKKVEEWVTAGLDIRPTRFITSAQKAAESSRRR